MKNKESSIIITGEDGSQSSPRTPRETERSKTREKEDEEYTPVIIKRNDEIVKHPDDTLNRAIYEGLEQFGRRSSSLVLSSLTGGLILGFVAMLVAFAVHLCPPDSSIAFKRFMMALFYPLGFIVCIVSGAKLYTEQTATAIYPVLEGKIMVSKLFYLWGMVLFGNILGAFLSSLLLLSADPIIMIGNGYYKIAVHLLEASSGPLMISSVLAGWLMAQGSWLILSTPNPTGQIICIYIVTFIIGIGGLTHSIAGSAELFLAYFSSDKVNFANVLRVIVIAVIGNSIGGSFFVGVLNYAHIRKTQKV